MSDWKFYRNGEIVPITEDDARSQFSHWEYLSDERGMACLLLEQMWAEIDRLRTVAAEAALREAMKASGDTRSGAPVPPSFRSLEIANRTRERTPFADRDGANQPQEANGSQG